MSELIPPRTAKFMITQSKKKIEKILIELKSGLPKTKQDNLVQQYGVEHTKIIGWQNKYYVYEECQPNGPVDLIFIKIDNQGKLVQFNIDAKGIHPNCRYFPQGKRRPSKGKFIKRDATYSRLQSVSWRLEDKNFTHSYRTKTQTKKKFYKKGFIVFKNAKNEDVTDKITKV